MPVDHRFEILKFLNDSSSGSVNILPFILPMIQRGEANRMRFKGLLQDLKEAGLIFVDNNDLSAFTRQMFNEYDDTTPLMVTLEYKGIDEYLRLKKLKQEDSPNPNTYSINIGRDFHGNLNQGNQAPVTQTINNLSNWKHFLFSINNSKSLEYQSPIDHIPKDYLPSKKALVLKNYITKSKEAQLLM